MITTKKLFSALVALSMSVVMVSCAGDDGEQGPEGPAGNANVNAFMFTVLEDDFDVTASSSGQSFRIRHRDTLDVPSINSDVMNSGNVQVFYTSKTFSPDTTAWTPMPNFDAGLSVNNHIAEGEVRIDINYIMSQPQSIAIGNFDFKVVVIPSASLVEGVDPTDYEALETVYGFE